MDYQNLETQLKFLKSIYEESSVENQKFEFQANARFIELAFRYNPSCENLPFLEILTKCSTLKRCNIIVKPFYCKNKSSLVLIRIPTRNKIKTTSIDIINQIYSFYFAK